MNDLDAMYQEIILDHYKHPQNAGLREPFEAEVHHVNPTCGDEVTMRVHLSGSGADAVAFAGVSKYPARIKCALMSWMALKDASARALSSAHPTAPTGGTKP